MAEDTRTTVKHSVSKIPALPSSTRKRTPYSKCVRRYNLKYQEPPPGHNVSTTSPYIPIITPFTSSRPSLDSTALATSGSDQPGDYALTSSTSSPASTFNTSARPSLDGHEPEPKPELEDEHGDNEPVTASEPGLSHAQFLLHAQLEVLMHALHQRLHDRPHLATSYVSAFEELAASTIFSGMGERIYTHVRLSKGLDLSQHETMRMSLAGPLQTHLKRETLRNARRCSQGWNFRDEHDCRSTVTEVRGTIYSREEKELTTSSSIDEVRSWHGSVFIDTEDEEGPGSLSSNIPGHFLDRCDCASCSEDMAELIQDYWAQVCRVYAATQELEMKLDCMEWCKSVAKEDQGFRELDRHGVPGETQYLECSSYSAEDEETVPKPSEDGDVVEEDADLNDNEPTNEPNGSLQYSSSSNASPVTLDSDRMSDWDWGWDCNSTSDDEQDEQDEQDTKDTKDTEDEPRWIAKVDADKCDLMEEIQHEVLVAEAALIGLATTATQYGEGAAALLGQCGQFL